MKKLILTLTLAAFVGCTTDNIEDIQTADMKAKVKCECNEYSLSAEVISDYGPSPIYNYYETYVGPTKIKDCDRDGEWITTHTFIKCTPVK